MNRTCENHNEDTIFSPSCPHWIVFCIVFQTLSFSQSMWVQIKRTTTRLNDCVVLATWIQINDNNLNWKCSPHQICLHSIFYRNSKFHNFKKKKKNKNSLWNNFSLKVCSLFDKVKTMSLIFWVSWSYFLIWNFYVKSWWVHLC